MNHEGLYEDLERMSVNALHAAVVWVFSDEERAMRYLWFAAECEQFKAELFLRGYGC